MEGVATTEPVMASLTELSWGNVSPARDCYHPFGAVIPTRPRLRYNPHNPYHPYQPLA